MDRLTATATAARSIDRRALAYLDRVCGRRVDVRALIGAIAWSRAGQ